MAALEKRPLKRKVDPNFVNPKDVKADMISAAKKKKAKKTETTKTKQVDSTHVMGKTHTQIICILLSLTHIGATVYLIGV